MLDFDTEMIARRFGLDPVPESVVHLTRLIASQNADLGAVASVITQDSMLTDRLLRLTQRGDKNEPPADAAAVEAALMRSGLGIVFLLAMGDLLMRALIRTFRIMLDSQLKPVLPREVAPIRNEHMVCEVNFRGKVAGKIQLRLTEETGRILAARMLGVPEASLSSSVEKDDAVTELVNVVAGNFLSNLADAGLPCHLAAPTLYRTSEFTMRKVPRGVSERLVFRSPEAKLFLDISVNPWSE